MGIFDRFSRLVRAELNHRTGGRSAVDPASWRASEPGDKGPPERARVRATDESARINQAWDLLERYYEVQSNSTT
jgi:hypothetical protein